VIDYEHFDGALGGLEFQPELVHCGEDDCEVGASREPVTTRIVRRCGARRFHDVLIRVIQIDIEFAGESGFIEDRLAQCTRQLPNKVRHVQLPSFHSQL
jgi:hypothetical protein